MRATKNLHQAIERIVPLVPSFIVEPATERGRYDISTPTDPWGIGRSNKRALQTLAILAEAARHSENAQAIREAVRWRGLPPSRGVSAHEEFALLWLTEAEVRP